MIAVINILLLSFIYTYNRMTVISIILPSFMCRYNRIINHSDLYATAIWRHSVIAIRRQCIAKTEKKEELCYKPEGLGFDSQVGQRHFSLTGVDSATNRNEYLGYLMGGGVKATGSYGWQPYHLHVPTEAPSDNSYKHSKHFSSFL